MAIVRSRILEYFNEDILKELNKVRRSKTIYSTNEKIKIALQILNKYNIDFVKLGDGTNRLAVLIDNYVFKIAMDDEGWRDNRNEFIVSPMLYPVVLKAYETNSLITVFEYVTLMSLDEYSSRSEEIMSILEKLSEEYLFGDIGYIKKNYQNWGYRNDGSLVILDYAYMYRIFGHMLRCHKCSTLLYYNRDYSELKCPSCGKTHSFWEVRKKIGMDRIDAMIEEELQSSLAVDRPINEVSIEEYNENFIGDTEEDEVSMYNKKGLKVVMAKMKKDFGFDTGSWDNDPYSSFENLARAVRGQGNSGKSFTYDSYTDHSDDVDEVVKDFKEVSLDDMVNNFRDPNVFQEQAKVFDEVKQHHEEEEEDFDIFDMSKNTIEYEALTPTKLVDDIIELLEGDRDSIDGISTAQLAALLKIRNRYDEVDRKAEESVEQELASNSNVEVKLREEPKAEAPKEYIVEPKAVDVPEVIQPRVEKDAEVQYRAPITEENKSEDDKPKKRRSYF